MDTSKEIISKLAKDIAIKGFSVPAIFFLESTKYISFVGSQLLVFLGPIATTFINHNKYYQLTDILEHKSNIEYLIQEIERFNLEK